MSDERPKAALWKRGLLLIASTLAALLVAEVAVRMLGLTDPVFRQADPVLGWMPVPGADGWWTREGCARVQISDQGFRGVDIPPGEPAAGTLRVAVIGDSYIEARQVALVDSFGAQLQTDLDACSPERVEVLAFGVSGFGTAQEYLLYRERVRAYHPDVVVLAFLAGNDIADNHPEIRPGEGPSPYFSVGPSGELVLDDSFRESPLFESRREEAGWLWFRRHSLLVRALHSMGGHGNGATRGELGLSDEVFAPPHDQLWRDAWARTEAILTHFDDDVRADGALFTVVTVSSAIQVDPEPEVREQYTEAIGADDLFYPDRRIVGLGVARGFPVLNLAPPLRAYAEAHETQLHGFSNTTTGTGHWNEAGHRVAARETSQWLCALLGPLRPRHMQPHHSE